MSDRQDVQMMAQKEQGDDGQSGESTTMPVLLFGRVSKETKGEVVGCFGDGLGGYFGHCRHS